jgi:hypothetical protein
MPLFGGPFSFVLFEHVTETGNDLFEGRKEQIQMIKRTRAATGIASTHPIASHGRRQ